MPVYSRPGRRHYATATKQVNHGEATIEDGFCGTAIKQRAPLPTDALAGRKTIGVGEAFCINTRGIVQVPFVAGVVPGDMLHITLTNNVLTETQSAGTRRYGRCTEVAGQRGTPTGFMRINLDDKTTD